MSVVKSTITAQFRQVAREQDRMLAPLSDQLKLVQSDLKTHLASIRSTRRRPQSFP